MELDVSQLTDEQREKLVKELMPYFIRKMVDYLNSASNDYPISFSEMMDKKYDISKDLVFRGCQRIPTYELTAFDLTFGGFFFQHNHLLVRADRPEDELVSPKFKFFKTGPIENAMLKKQPDIDSDDLIDYGFREISPD